MHECNYSFFPLSINNKLQQPEAASGVLEYAMKHFGELVSAFSLSLFFSCFKIDIFILLCMSTL